MPQNSASIENYLEAIATLMEGGGRAQATAIARAMGVTKPSVTVALKALAQKGYITYAAYQPVRLTPRGRAIARGVARRHALLRRFLVDALGLAPGHADALACRLEHVFDDVAFRRLSSFMRALPPPHSSSSSASSTGVKRASKGRTRVLSSVQ